MRVALLALLLTPRLWADEPLVIVKVRIDKARPAISDPQSEYRPVYASVFKARAERDKRVRPSTAARDFRPARGTPLALRREAIAAAIASGQDGGAAWDEYYRRVQALLARREKYGRKSRQR